MDRLKRAVIIYVLALGTLALATFNVAWGNGWPTNYQHFNQIRETAQGLDKGTRIMFTLNDGTQVFGEYLSYEKYNDYIWYQPLGTGRNWFKQDAFDVHEIFRLDIVALDGAI